MSEFSLNDMVMMMKSNQLKALIREVGSYFGEKKEWLDGYIDEVIKL